MSDGIRLLAVLFVVGVARAEDDSSAVLFDNAVLLASYEPLLFMSGDVTPVDPRNGFDDLFFLTRIDTGISGFDTPLIVPAFGDIELAPIFYCALIGAPFL